MKAALIFAATFTFIVIVDQSAALRQELSASHQSSVGTCDLKDIGSKFEQLVTKGVYALGDAVINLEAAAYDSVGCFSEGFSQVFSCLKDVWTAELQYLAEGAETYQALVVELVSGIASDLLTCVHL